MARRVAVAHPGRLRLIFRAKRKNDRVDARKLAKLLYLDEVPEAYVPSEDVQSWRELIEHRRRVVDRQTTCKNAIRSLLRSHGVLPPKGLWSKKGLAWLERLRCHASGPTQTRPSAGRTGRGQTAGADYYQGARRDRGSPSAVMLLRTIPGVGIRTAETMVAYIDDPKRFRRSGQVAAYFGLIPCQDACAGINRLGHITRQGPGTARKYLVEAAPGKGSIVRPPSGPTSSESGAARRSDARSPWWRPAHYLLRCMHAMLVHGQSWREAA